MSGQDRETCSFIWSADNVVLDYQPPLSVSQGRRVVVAGQVMASEKIRLQGRAAMTGTFGAIESVGTFELGRVLI